MPTYVKKLRVEEWNTINNPCLVPNVTWMFDYVTRMYVHNFSIALITFIPYMHEYLSIFLNETWRINLINQASGFKKEMI